MEIALFRVIKRTTVPQKGEGTQWLMNCTKQTIIDFTALKGKKKKPWRWVIQMEQNEKKKKTVIEQTACKYEQTANDHQVSNKRHFNSAKRIMNMQNLKYHRKFK